MKELSMEAKAKRYSEAIERAKGVIEQNPLIEYLKKAVEYIFPELKESDDEKIKYEIKVVLANTDLSQFALEYTFADMLAWLEKQGEQKPAWSEEDEKIYQSIMDDTVQENQLDGKQIDWIRDIKYRYFSQSRQEWSEEDEKKNEDEAIRSNPIPELPSSAFRLGFKLGWFKSLRPQNNWKPSDEQMDAL